jgi:hypothetical protein
MQVDIFKCPIRLYQGLLHNNKLGIGNRMGDVRLPLIKLYHGPSVNPLTGTADDIDNVQINPSCLLAYLGIRGIGWNATISPQNRDFNAIPFIAYWDIYKNYYANKQEEIGVVIHAPKVTLINTVTSINIGLQTVPQAPTITISTIVESNRTITVNFTGTRPLLNQILISTNHGNFTLEEVAETVIENGGNTEVVFNWARYGNTMVFNWDYQQGTNLGVKPPELATFPLTNLDDMREAILTNLNTSPYYVNSLNKPPYSYLALSAYDSEYVPSLQTQEGLAVKTYQSDILNNWLSTEWISGVNGINEITAISTVGDKFTLDTLYLSNKVYQMLNRIAVSGGSYDDWLDAVYTHDRFTRSETPTYHGGLSKELIFQEVVSNSESGTQPLGTLAGKGTMGRDQKGGSLTIKVDEPSYILGIVSLTPRIDYSQGNVWHTYSLISMDDLHKPALDQIGFQDAAAEQMAWWANKWDGSTYIKPSYGKQTGWIHYQTSINRTYGNFAIKDNEMFMTLNRRYEPDFVTGTMKDMTTYIDPSKFNNIFAQTSLDAQNFWIQIGVEMIVRRKMSAKVMPNL